MKYRYFSLALLVTVVSCDTKHKKWLLEDTIGLGEITPIGLVYNTGKLWISDGDHNQVVAINLEGVIIDTLGDLQRPMHIDFQQDTLFIPEYGSDQITLFSAGKTTLEIPYQLDAPAAIAVLDEEMAIVDFYNHRILFYDGLAWSIIGKKGKAFGELFYPTDVHLLTNKIVIADAYNNRVQVFSKKGKPLKIIGEADKMNAATGVYADPKTIFVTDFENNRVLVYNHQGELLQIITADIQKPTDVVVIRDCLYVANYKGKSITKYKKQ